MRNIIKKITYSKNPIIVSLIQGPIVNFIFFLRKIKLTKLSRFDNRCIKSNEKLVSAFKEALYQFSYVRSGDAGIFINAYLNKFVVSIKIAQVYLGKNEPILLCVVKNDLEKVKLQIEYHRKIGVRHFAYIDNLSQDGTFEWLKEQSDVSLFSVSEKFHITVKDAWKKQVTDLLGYDKWYLILDSDELFIYPGIEEKNINKYIDFLEYKKIKSTFSPMIDMYSDKKLFGRDVSPGGIMEEYCFFDTDSYVKIKNGARYNVRGGPRARLFSTKSNPFYCGLGKYALTKVREDMIIFAHFNLPYKYNFGTKGAIAFLLHYKFLMQDSVKYMDHIKSGVMSSGGSSEYKVYMQLYEKNPELTFFYENAQKLNNSMDLMKINLIDEEFFSDFLKNDI